MSPKDMTIYIIKFKNNVQNVALSMYMKHVYTYSRNYINFQVIFPMTN